jgi:hypothetical protein
VTVTTSETTSARSQVRCVLSYNACVCDPTLFSWRLAYNLFHRRVNRHAVVSQNLLITTTSLSYAKKNVEPTWHAGRKDKRYPILIQSLKPIYMELNMTDSQSKDMAAHQHHSKAAEHHDQASKHHKEAAKHHEAGDHKTAAHHAHTAQGHAAHANEHASEASKKHANTHGQK